jgi:glutaredoxin
VAENTVAIFSKTHCPYCKRIKGFFKDKGIEFEAMELDIMGQLGKDIQVYSYDYKMIINIYFYETFSTPNPK